MDSVNPIVLDSSSDEEPDRQGDNFELIAEVLGVVDKRFNDTDEVEVVAEVRGSMATDHRKSKSSNPMVESKDDDDDCVVLDGDPDKAVVAATAVGQDDNTVETEEVLVVGQKGQIACRDFPHPRHSCAKYPFSSTSHEKYCDMCHCYVCDTRAPCSYWCVGVSSIDHCHANDKEKIWKSQREYFRTGKTAPQAIPGSPATTNPSTVTPHLGQSPTRRLIRVAPTSIPQNQVGGIRACSSSAGVTGIPNIRARCRFRQSGSFLPYHGLQQRSGPLPGGVRCNIFQKSRVPTFGNLGSRVVSSNRIAETPQVSGGGIMVANLSGFGSSNNNSNNNNSNNTAQGLQYTQKSPLLAPTDRWEDVSPTINLEVYTQQCNLQSNLTTGYFPVAPTSQSHNVHSQQLGPDLTAIDSCWGQTNVDLFAPTEASHQPMADCQTQNFEQLGDNNFPQRKVLSEFEDWLMDNLPVPASSLPDPLGLSEGELTFDFETFLNS